jgi:Tfp pilus assembly protein PilN
VSAPLNLSRRPLRNERLPTLVLVIACAALGVLSVHHALVAWELRGGGGRDAAGQLAHLESEADDLAREAAALAQAAPAARQLEEWSRIREIVDHRTFSWTGLFAALEAVLPEQVRLVSVVPAFGEDEGMSLSLTVIGRDYADGVALLRALQADKRFSAPRLLSMSEESDAGGVTINGTVRYLGPPARGAR